MSFNPCFSGSYIMTLFICLEKLILTGFNPCFSGSYIMTHPQPLFRHPRQSFNPCFSGSYIMTGWRYCILYIRIRVSILVLVDLILWRGLTWRKWDILWVSILVLVDLILWHTPEKTKNYETLGFNPCFSGSYIMTIIPPKIIPSLFLCFNPCFSGSYIMTTTYNNLNSNEEKFQSLF